MPSVSVRRTFGQMSEPRSQAESQFSWTAHPAFERPRHAVAASVVILAIAVAIWLSFESLAWGGLALIVLLLALNRFFLPSRFTITSEGITATYPLLRKRAQWRYLRRFVCDDHGGYLSTRSQPSRMDAYRGMHLLFGRDATQRDAIIKRIRGHMARNESTVNVSVAAEAHGEAAA